MRNWLKPIIPVFVFACFASTLPAELKIEGKPQWGYNGNVEVEQFNLLTVHVFNDSQKPWQGVVQVKPLGGIQSVDVPVVLPDQYIEAGGMRELQFHTFLPNTAEFRIEWGNYSRGRFYSEGEFDIDPPKINYVDLTIELIDPEAPGKRDREIITFDERSFPTSATVLNGVGAIVLDHVPGWQEPQTRAFLDWLHNGGRLYLVSPTQTDHLEFPSGLIVLNEPSSEFPVGYGLVVRGLPEQATPDKPNQESNNSRRSYKNLDIAGTLFSIMKAMTTPDHNWGLIYFMAVLYLLVLFPGCWLLGRKKGDYRLTYSVILGTVGLFSLGFHSVGKRGYGEETTVNSVAVVTPAQPGRWIVKQWSNIFITKGGDYTVTYDRDGQAISTGQHAENVFGIAVNQPDGTLQTDIPSFSNRSVVAAGILKHKGIRPELSEFRPGKDGAERLKFKLPNSADWPTILASYAVFGNRAFPLTLHEGELTMIGQGQPFSNHFSYESLRYNPYSWGRFDEVQEGRDQLYDKTIMPIIAGDLRIFNENDIPSVSLNKDHLRLYVVTEMNPEFFAAGDITPQQFGRTVYAFKFNVP